MSLAVVLGGAQSLKADVGALSRMAPEALEAATIIAVNEAGYEWPGPLHHWVSLHPEGFTLWTAEREERGYPDGYTTWSRRNPEMVDRLAEHWGAGSSGFYGVTIAYYLGVEKVVLCGVPIDETPHWFNHPKWGNKPWREHYIHRPGWERRKEQLMGRVKSLSGWTRELLGAPTKEWLNTKEAA